MTADLHSAMGGWHAVLERRLSERLPLSTLPGAGRLNEAVRQAVFPGGRRWRPALTLLGTLAVDRRPESVLDVACGIEFIHTSSLILDDLPAMDDGWERRGRPTLHRVFGEGIAVLAALALLNRGYELFLEPLPDAEASATGARLVREAALAIGTDGMIGGQAADLAGRHAAPLASRQRKTTTLVRLAAIAGAVAAGADERDVDALARYGEGLGSAYQIYDDLLDAGDNGHAAGKTAGQDARHGRASWTACGGTAVAMAAARAEIDAAGSAVRTRFGDTPATRLLTSAAADILDSIVNPPVPAPVEHHG